jgi:hypothetical protein
LQDLGHQLVHVEPAFLRDILQLLDQVTIQLDRERHQPQGPFALALFAAVEGRGPAWFISFLASNLARSVFFIALLPQVFKTAF